MNEMDTKLASPFVLLKQAWSFATLRPNIFSYLALGAIPSLFSLVISALAAYFFRFDILSNAQGWMIAGLIIIGVFSIIVMSFVSAWYSALLYKVYQATATGTKNRLTTYIRPARAVTIHLLVTYITVGLFTFLGFLLLVIPGIIIAIRYMFAPLIAAVEDRTIKPIDESKRLVKGRFWKLVGRVLVLILCYNIPLSLFQSIHPLISTVWGVTSPVFGLYFFLVYLDFKRTAAVPA